jgi:hypothetical protein
MLCRGTNAPRKQRQPFVFYSCRRFIPIDAMRHYFYPFFLYAFVLSITSSVSTFLRFPRKADFCRLKYERSSSVASALESTSRDAESTRIETCARDFEDIFPNPESLIHKFHIHGWRWHTLSLLRDFSRLEKLASRLSHSPSSSSIDTSSTVSKAIHHVVGFSWKGLHRIESQVFFPWLRQKLLGNDSLKPLYGKSLGNNISSIQSSLEHVLNQMEAYRTRIDEVSKEMVRSFHRLVSCSLSTTFTQLVSFYSRPSVFY